MGLFDYFKLKQVKRDLISALKRARPAGIELKEEPLVAAAITSLLASPEGVAFTVVRSGDTVTLCHRNDLEGRINPETRMALQQGDFLINPEHWSVRR